MTGCYTCGGGMGKHDPVAHDQVTEVVPRGWWLDVVEADEETLIWVEDDDPA